MKYFGNWGSKRDIAGDFQIDIKALSDVNIIVAWYSYEDYSGSAFVLFEQGGQLFEVNGGHCSCYGLEGQWEPEETSIEALRHYLDNGEVRSEYVTTMRRYLRSML